MNNQEQEQEQEQVDQRGTPLMDAINDGNLMHARQMAVDPGHVEESDNDGRGPLHCLARQGGQDHIEITEILLNNGANVNQVDEQGDSPLHTAIYNGNLLMAMLLLRHGANPRLFPDTDETYPVLYTLMA